MINRIVILKINRAVFPPYNPIEVMIGFFDKQGTQQGSQLLSASLFPEGITKGQQIDFNSPPTTLIVDLDKVN